MKNVHFQGTGTKSERGVTFPINSIKKCYLFVSMKFALNVSFQLRMRITSLERTRTVSCMHSILNIPLNVPAL